MSERASSVRHSDAAGGSEAAALAGMSKSTLSRLETGQRRPSLKR
jgi:transcriptional regulator with XRE-family HTH domain